MHRCAVSRVQAEKSSEADDSERKQRSEDAETPAAGQGIMAGQLGVTQATIEIIHEENYQTRTSAYGGCDEVDLGRNAGNAPPADTVAGMASNVAITSEAILESLLKFEEERIPLAARLERYTELPRRWRRRFRLSFVG